MLTRSVEICLLLRGGQTVNIEPVFDAMVALLEAEDSKVGHGLLTERLTQTSDGRTQFYQNAFMDCIGSLLTKQSQNMWVILANKGRPINHEFLESSKEDQHKQIVSNVWRGGNFADSLVYPGRIMAHLNRAATEYTQLMNRAVVNWDSIVTLFDLVLLWANQHEPK
mmetsp:Transcript_11887/g.26552  ORF Transcript_11887/g.26552 Transcript_11887/m.26552 type:complete len:167 (+) Transcript_11887:269-769(+)